MNSLIRSINRPFASVQRSALVSSFVHRANQPPSFGIRTLKSSAKTRKRSEAPKIRYLFYMFLISSGCLYFAGNKVDKKKPKTSFNSDREFHEYEEITGLKRRNKLFNHESNINYKFYLMPFSNERAFEKIVSEVKKGGDGRQIRIIDPKDLIEEEKQDDTRKYCYLLQDLESQGKKLPKGLITALIKKDLQFFLNTRGGTFDTNIIIKNYPQTTDEAIRFENDVSDVQICYTTELPNDLEVEESRLIRNVFGYFETVGKTKKV